MSCSWPAWRRVPSAPPPRQPWRSLSKRRRQVLLRIAKPVFQSPAWSPFSYLTPECGSFVTARKTDEVYGNRELLSIKILSLCCTKVIMSGVNGNVIMSGWRDDNPDDERREAARGY